MNDVSKSASAAGPAAVSKPSPSRRGSRKRLLWLLAVIVVLGIAGWGAWYLAIGRWFAVTDDAYVHGNIVQITPKVAGTVVSIGADNGDLVHQGQVLVRLDPSDTMIALQAAEAQLALTVRQVRGLYNDAAVARAEMAARQTELGKAQADYDRRRRLAPSGAVSAELLSHARDALALARSNLVVAEQKFHRSEALIAGTDVADSPGVKAAEAKLRAACLNHLHTRLIAPVDGYIAQRTVQLGEQVAPGRALMAVVPLHQVWVDANFKETQLEDMRIGQPVRLTADLYGSSVTYRGRVEALGIGTGSAFSLLPAENATGNWIKVVQRLPVRITLDPRQLDRHPLRIGLSMTARVDLHDTSGAMLAARPPSHPVLATDVYHQQLAEADRLIARIVAANLGTPGK